MSSRDPLVSRFAALRAEVPSTAPGVEAARRTVATRRRRRLVGAVAALVLATSGVAVVVARASGTPQVATTPSPSVSTSIEPSPATSSRPPGPGAGAGGSSVTGSPTSAPGRSPASSSPSCVPTMNANVTGVVGFDIDVSLAPAKPRCPNERLRVFWASYTIDEADVQHLFRSGTSYLDPANPTVHFAAVMPTQCLGRTLYVAEGPAVIPGTITTGTDMMKVDPFRVPRPGIGNFLWASDRVACPSPAPSG
jgi:hypothetical protein